MTVVKIQRPIRINGISGDEGPWLVYDKYRAREDVVDEIPNSIKKVFDAAPPQTQAYFKQYFDGAEWDEILECWDLDECVPITRRLIW